MTRLILALLCTLMLVPDGRAHDLTSPLPFDVDARTGTLENGVTWYVRPNAEPRDRAALRLVLNAGSVLEDDDQRGLAHFLEHMAFNGTENFEKHELVDYLESIGIEFGPEINAYTSFDQTVYMLTVPTDDETILENAFLVLADWSRRISMDPEEVTKERGVVLEEWRLGRGARQRIMDEQIPLIYHGSRYAERLPIGDPGIIETADPERLRRFYEEWYRPDLMAVVAVGDFDPERIIALIQEHFGGDWGARRGTAERPGHEIPDHDETLFAISSDPELTSSSVRVLVKKPSRPTETLQDYRANIVEGLYDGMFGNRLQELTEKPDPPFIVAGMGGSRLGKTTDTVFLNAIAEDGGIARALESVLVEAKRVAEHGFTESELKRQKERVLRSVRRQFQERETTPSSTFAGRYLGHFLEGSPALDAQWRWEFYQEVVPSITLDEVNALVVERDVLGERNRVVLASVPEKEGLAAPTREEIFAVFERVGGIEVEPYVDDVSTAPLFDAEIEPGAIVRAEEIAELGITHWILSNGIEVYVKPTDFREDQFSVAAFSPGGRSLGTLDLDRSLDFATTMADVGGVGEFDSIELGKKLAGKRVSMYPYIDTYEEGFRGGGSPEDLETVLQLLWLYVHEPRHDENAFRAIQQRYGPFLKNRSLDPASIYGDTISVTLAGGHPWGTPLTEEQVMNADLDRGLEFFRDRLSILDGATFVFVGNLDLESLAKQVELYVGSLPADLRTETWRDPGIESPEGPLHKVVHAGVDEKARTTLVMHGDFDWNRRDRFALGALAKGLNIRLREVIREDLSGTYGVSVELSSNFLPTPRWSGRIAFGADPERLDELVEQALGVLADVRENGLDPATIEKVREQFQREQEENVRSNSYWSSVIGFRARHGLDQREELETDALIESLDAEMLASVARRYLPIESILRFDHLPE